MSAKLMMVIVTDMECRGKGVEGDPYRRITQYWTPDGKLLVEKDPCEMVEPTTCSAKNESYKERINWLETMLAKAFELVKRYRGETPLGNQPSMIAEKADEFIVEIMLSKRKKARNEQG